MCPYDDWPVLLEHSPVTMYTGRWCLGIARVSDWGCPGSWKINTQHCTCNICTFHRVTFIQCFVHFLIEGAMTPGALAVPVHWGILLHVHEVNLITRNLTQTNKSFLPKICPLCCRNLLNCSMVRVNISKVSLLSLSKYFWLTDWLKLSR